MKSEVIVVTERERLIELLQSVPVDCTDCRGVGTIADYLLENGVIVPPVKVGDTIYKLDYTECHNGETHPDSYGCCGCYDECDMRMDIFKFVVPSKRFIVDRLMDIQNNPIYFFTRKEAEKALSEQKK